MSTRDEDEALNDVRRAAFVLREKDPTAAVRILRQVVRRGGDAAPLAHGALGEILLEDFEDLDGAAHHFREVLKLVAFLPAAEIGLSRALGRQGLAVDAGQAQARALEGLARLITQAISSVEDDAAEALEETLLTFLELAVERRELAADAGIELSTEPSLDDAFAWAEQQRLFDDEDDPVNKDDWARYADLRALTLGFASRVSEAESLLARLAPFVPLPEGAVAHARSLALEAAGELERAAEAARAALPPALLDASPVSILRTADLERASGRTESSTRLLEGYRMQLASLPKDESAPILAEIEARLRPVVAAPTLVRLGVKRRTE